MPRFLAAIVVLLLAACAPGEPELRGTARFAQPLPADATLTLRLVPEEGAVDAPLYSFSENVPAGTRRHDFVLPYDPQDADIRYALRGRIDGDGLLWLGESDDDLVLGPRGLRARIRLAPP